MDAVTYPSEKVIKAINENVIPLRYPHDAIPISEEYNVKWTPSLHIIGEEGKVHLESTGFFPPEELVPWIITGRGRLHFDRDELDNAETMFGKVVTEYPESQSAPQAVFYNAVCEYKKSHEGDRLKEGYEKLKEKYRGNIWTQKALPYRLL